MRDLVNWRYCEVGFVWMLGGLGMSSRLGYVVAWRRPPRRAFESWLVILEQDASILAATSSS